MPVYRWHIRIRISIIYELVNRNITLFYTYFTHSKMRYLKSIFLIAFVVIDQKGSVWAQYCLENEIFMDCSMAVEPTCEVPGPINNHLCRPGKCQCAEGFIRQRTGGPCIPVDQCFGEESGKGAGGKTRKKSRKGKDNDGSKRPDCKSTEYFASCPVKTEPTCQFPEPVNFKTCQPPKCQCKEFYIRLRPDGPCIHESQCNKYQRKFLLEYYG